MDGCCNTVRNRNRVKNILQVPVSLTGPPTGGSGSTARVALSPLASRPHRPVTFGPTGRSSSPRRRRPDRSAAARVSIGSSAPNRTGGSTSATRHANGDPDTYTHNPVAARTHDAGSANTRGKFVYVRLSRWPSTSRSRCRPRENIRRR